MRYQVNAVFYYTGTAHIEAETQKEAEFKASQLQSLAFDREFSEFEITSVEEEEVEELTEGGEEDD